jgi:hypothetical protein
MGLELCTPALQVHFEIGSSIQAYCDIQFWLFDTCLFNFEIRIGIFVIKTKQAFLPFKQMNHGLNVDGSQNACVLHKRVMGLSDIT